MGAAIVLTVFNSAEGCRHQWGRWSEVVGTRVFTIEHDDQIDKEAVTATQLYITQERKCTKCGLIEIKGDSE